MVMSALQSLGSMIAQQEPLAGSIDTDSWIYFNCLKIPGVSSSSVWEALHFLEKLLSFTQLMLPCHVFELARNCGPIWCNGKEAKRSERQVWFSHFKKKSGIIEQAGRAKGNYFFLNPDTSEAVDLLNKFKRASQWPGYFKEKWRKLYFYTEWNFNRA